MHPIPEECAFTMRSGIVIAAKYWKNGAADPARDRRRFLAFHGLLDNAATFDLLAPLLLDQLGPESVEILSVDLAGHGLSSHRQTGDYSFWRDLEDAEQIADLLGWSKHAVMGHSLGGAIAGFYAGLFPTRTTLCITLDGFGPWTREIDSEPDRLLNFLTASKLKAPSLSSFTTTGKRSPQPHPPFYASVEAAIHARVDGSNWFIDKKAAAIITPRSLMPVERVDEHGCIFHGYTWRSDRMLKVVGPSSPTDDYAKAFMSRIICPFVSILATNGFRTLFDVKKREKWIANASVFSVYTVEGYHHVHLEDPDLVAQKVSEWILAQDHAPQARL